MKLRALLLMVSVVCLFVLVPAAALSQGRGVTAGCGAATVDGVMSPGEWTPATRVALAPIDRQLAPEWVPGDGGSDVSPAQGPSGWLYLMNDGARFLYVAAVMSFDGMTADPDNWNSWMCVNFADEPDALDDKWAAPDCGPLPKEGWYCDEDGEGMFVAPSGAPHHFLPVSEASECGEQTPNGVSTVVGPATTLVWEWRLNLNASELDKVGPGDCFRFSSGMGGNACEEGTNCTLGAGGLFTWPEGLFDGDFPDTFGTLCLNECLEEEFVPEPGTLLLLGSGLMGLAGYASLRLRER